MAHWWNDRRTAPGPAREGRGRLIAAVSLAGALCLSAPTGIRAQTSAAKPSINVAAHILVEPASETPFGIQVEPQDASPQQSFLRIRGLPASANLTEGHAIAPGAWAIPRAALPRLKIATPAGVTGRHEVTISLVAIDGTILSEAKSSLIFGPVSALAPPAPVRSSAPPAATAATGTVPANPPSPTAALRLPPETRPAPPAPAVPQLSPEDRQRALKLMERGDEGIGAGNVTVARLFYQRAAELGWGPAALALAGTYDPDELTRLGVIGGVQSDPALARKWYERARELGAAEAAERLQRLGAR